MARNTPALNGETPIDDQPAEPGWGSDVLAATLRDLGLEFIALNPGSSYRGLHDSLVNYLGNSAPQMLLCLHEEHAVAIAHGYAKVTDRAMGVALHSNVGLMHGSMALFNAFCDRVPMLVLGATGPLDAARRRPWIDWLHTATDQAALVRPFLKWDDQPLSVPAAVEALLQAHRLASSRPCAPTYVCLDTSIQEGELSAGDEGALGSPNMFRAAAPPAPAPADVEKLALILEQARSTVLLIGRTTRDSAAWRRRVDLAERLDAAVFTHLKLPAAFPTRHPQHVGGPQGYVSPALQQALRDADVVLSLEWLDLGGALHITGPIDGQVVSVSLDEQLHGGWGKESLTPVPADLHIHAGGDALVAALLERLPDTPRRPAKSVIADTPSPRKVLAGAPITVDDVARELRAALAGTPSCLVRVPLSWDGALWDAGDPLDVLGGDGGEGVGSGTGMTVGAALALRDSERVVASVLGDGDFLMGVNALWTAAHYELPLLIVVVNNQSFFNDEVHQHRVAEARGRPTENRWIGQRIAGPEIDLPALARAQGLTAHGPISDLSQLEDALARAVLDARGGASVVVDVRIRSTPAGDGARAAGHAERG